MVWEEYFNLCSQEKDLCFVYVQALVIAGISLQAANLYGYVLCKMGGESDVSKITASFLSQTVFQTVSYSSLTPGPLISRHLQVPEACW